jgi:hypothetical protein
MSTILPTTVILKFDFLGSVDRRVVIGKRVFVGAIPPFPE